MFFEVVAFALLGSCMAQLHHEDGHHGASSYSTVSLGHEGHEGSYFGQAGHGLDATYGHGLSLHAAPVVLNTVYAAPPAIQAAPIIHATPAHHSNEHQVDYHAHPKYEFKYGVADAHSGDHHSQQESRDGDVVHGEYSLHESDGTIRTVKYTADHKNGFNAQVIRSGHASHPETHQHHYAPVNHGNHYGGNHY